MNNQAFNTNIYHDKLFLVESESDGWHEVESDHEEQLQELHPPAFGGAGLGQVLLGGVELLLGGLTKLLSPFGVGQRLHRRVEPTTVRLTGVVDRWNAHRKELPDHRSQFIFQFILRGVFKFHLGTHVRQ